MEPQQKNRLGTISNKKYWGGGGLKSILQEVTHRASYGVYISQLVRFARVCNHVADFSARNKLEQSNFSSRAIGIIGIGTINFGRQFINFIPDSMNCFPNLMSDPNRFHVRAFRNQHFMLTWFTNLRN